MAKQNPKQLREERADLIEEAQKLIDRADKENRKLTESEEREWNRLTTEIEEKMEIIEVIEARERKQADEIMKAWKKREGIPDEGDTEITWRTKKGEPINVYAKSVNIHSGKTAEMDLGDTVRALVHGPRNEAERRTLSEGTASAGGYTVPEVLAKQVIDLQRKKTRVIQAGAITIALTSDNLTMAKILTDPTVAFREELAAIATGDPTFGAVTWTPRSIAGLVRVSRELLEDSININEALTQALIGTMAVKFDEAALVGSGVSPNPLGVANFAGKQVISMGTNGGAISGYSQLVQAQQKMYEVNAGENTAAIMSPRTWAAYANLTATDGQPLMMPKAIEKLPMLETTSIVNNSPQGTSNVSSKIILGDFRNLVVGMRLSLTIRLLQEKYADTNEVAFIAIQRYDIAALRENNFVVIEGIIPA